MTLQPRYEALSLLVSRSWHAPLLFAPPWLAHLPCAVLARASPRILDCASLVVASLPQTPVGTLLGVQPHCLALPGTVGHPPL